MQKRFVMLVCLMHREREREREREAFSIKRTRKKTAECASATRTTDRLIKLVSPHVKSKRENNKEQKKEVLPDDISLLLFSRASPSVVNYTNSMAASRIRQTFALTRNTNAKEKKRYCRMAADAYYHIRQRCGRTAAAAAAAAAHRLLDTVLVLTFYQSTKKNFTSVTNKKREQ